MKDLFPTKKDKESVVAAFLSLIKSEAWKNLYKIVDANREVLKQKILEGKTGNNLRESIEDVRVARAKLKAYDEVLDTPGMFIRQFSEQDEPEVNEDVYETVDDVTMEVPDS